MSWLTDGLYLLILALTAPVWLSRRLRLGKLRTDWRGRLGHVTADGLDPSGGRPRIVIHAVSVGEVNAIRLLVEQLSLSPERPQVVIAVTTDTGFARATDLFGPDYPVVRYPLDFSWMVKRWLRSLRPDAMVLVELELWPNMIRQCARRNVPVGIVNGRLSDRSVKRYRLVRALIAPCFRKLAFAAVQDETYAGRFRALGAQSDRVIVAGTMKWDTAHIADDVKGAHELAGAMGIDRGRPLVVGGSTAPGEHELLVQSMPPGVQLLCAPRRPEWADDAASAMPGCARRSTGDRGSETGRFLLDTIGELRAAYALADVVVVGRSFGNLWGSDMIEPIALGKATIIGPAIDDFQETVRELLAGGGLIQTTRDNLPLVLAELLSNADRRADLAERGRAVIREKQGATARQATLILEHVGKAAR